MTAAVRSFPLPLPACVSVVAGQTRWKLPWKKVTNLQLEFPWVFVCLGQVAKQTTSQTCNSCVGGCVRWMEVRVWLLTKQISLIRRRWVFSWNNFYKRNREMIASLRKQKRATQQLCLSWLADCECGGRNTSRMWAEDYFHEKSAKRLQDELITTWRDCFSIAVRDARLEIRALECFLVRNLPAVCLGVNACHKVVWIIF